MAGRASASEFSLGERLTHFVSAYDTIVLTSTLVFSFAVSLAAEYSSKEFFDNDTLYGNARMYAFHSAISLCIGCSLHCIVILSLINYQINRNIGKGVSDFAADYLENTYKYRQHARISFGASLTLFVGSLCVLYWNGLPTILAISNTVILLIFLLIISISMYQMGHSKIIKKVEAKKRLSNKYNSVDFDDNKGDIHPSAASYAVNRDINNINPVNANSGYIAQVEMNSMAVARPINNNYDNIMTNSSAVVQRPINNNYNQYANQNSSAVVQRPMNINNNYNNNNMNSAVVARGSINEQPYGLAEIPFQHNNAIVTRAKRMSNASHISQDPDVMKQMGIYPKSIDEYDDQNNKQ